MSETAPQSGNRTVHRTCTLCEACCGLDIDVDGAKIVSVRPDHDDVRSHGFVCPKGIAISAIHDDPDRLRQPMRRMPGGTFEPIGWDEALDLAAERLRGIRAEHGANAVALYTGNPVIHNHGALLVRAGLTAALGTKNSYSAGSQDTSPRFATSNLLYGSSFALPIPDVDRTDYLLCLGANPLISNGSVLTAPNMKKRLRAIRERGGKLVIVDPRQTETARVADEHVPIRPGGDAAFLLAMVGVLIERGRLPHSTLAEVTRGWADVERRIGALGREDLSRSCDVPVATIERLALEFADAPTAAAYSRIGICNNRYGTLATYATDLLNLAAGRLGKVGGAMFTTPAIDTAAFLVRAKQDGYARWRSRVRDLPETLGDLPSACLAEEMETPGPGQIRALVTFAGNPVLTTPNGRRLGDAISKLDFMVAIDLYVNETTRHADLILPPAWTLTEPHIDLFFGAMSARNIARWSPPVVPIGPDEKHDWEIMLALSERLGGGPTGIRPLDRALSAAKNIGQGFDPTHTADLLLRTGPYGDWFLPWSKGLSVKKLKDAPHGIDLGPLEEGVSRRVFHRDKLVHVDAPPLLEALDAFAGEVRTAAPDDQLLLIGRRELRTCNSWMHNVEALVSGRDRCILYVHPEDAERAGIFDGGVARMESRVHAGEVKIRVTDELMPGVVSLPHGWGHAAAAPWQRVAGSHPGISINDWTDDQEVESVVGQSILNGVAVRLGPCAEIAVASHA